MSIIVSPLYMKPGCKVFARWKAKPAKPSGFKAGSSHFGWMSWILRACGEVMCGHSYFLRMLT